MTNPQKKRALQRAKRHLANTVTSGKDFAESQVGSEWKAAYKEIDKVIAALTPPVQKKLWTLVGPVQPGGKSLLDMSLTHATGGIPLFPAVDTDWGDGGGVQVIAPEDCVVDTKDTHAAPGEALYLRGASGLRYWLGHISRDYPLGHKFKKGEAIALTIDQSPGADHLHCGVNAEALLGKGKQLLYGATGHGPDYTTGSPTIRKQLEGR